MLYNYHTHTTYCDGKNTAEEMVRQAIKSGLSQIGFSGHSYTSFDEEPCMSRQGTEEYKKEINALKQKYKDKIKIVKVADKGAAAEKIEPKQNQPKPINSKTKNTTVKKNIKTFFHCVVYYLHILSNSGYHI